ncbi:MAG: YHYH protein [Akkermansiaceae bacterium]
MKIRKHLIPSALLLAGLTHLAPAEALIDSWHTAHSGRYARIWATQAQETDERQNGVRSSLKTWDSANYPGVMIGDQPMPVYAGVQGISYSEDYVYIKSTGLATNTMGPWFLNEAQTTAFPSFPGNSAILYRFPRSSNYPENYAPATRTPTNIGSCGLFVDGVPLFNTSDTFSYDTSAGGDQEPTNQNRGDGYWNRDAFTNEGVTFDAGNTHQAMEQFHYHASPNALRSTLGDSIDYNPTVVYKGIGKASPYTENFNGTHSPILAWANDGLPMYGPYGYSDPSDATSEVRRMVSGYQKRDGTNGSTNLAATGRTTMPQWVVAQGVRTTRTLSSAFYGPNVSSAFTLGHYMEDYEYKGHLTSDVTNARFAQYFSASLGIFQSRWFYDLNEYNVRYCVTPEFPEGTWAYFTAVDDNGTPVYPYNLAWHYFGDPTVASGVTEIGETVIDVFTGAAGKGTQFETATLDDDSVTVVWNGIEGGVYQITESLDLKTWTAGPSFTAGDQLITLTETGNSRKYYTIERTGLADYDTSEFGTTAGGGGPGGGGPGGGTGGTPGTGNPTDGFVFSFADGPPQANLISNLKVGGVTGTVVSYNVNGPAGGTITISFNADSFSSGIAYRATYLHSPPGAGTVTATSTNWFTKP